MKGETYKEIIGGLEAKIEEQDEYIRIMEKVQDGEKEQPCEWKHKQVHTADNVNGSMYEIQEYYISCKKQDTHVFNEGKYCPYCGRLIKVVE